MNAYWHRWLFKNFNSDTIIILIFLFLFSIADSFRECRSCGHDFTSFFRVSNNALPSFLSAQSDRSRFKLSTQNVKKGNGIYHVPVSFKNRMSLSSCIARSGCHFMARLHRRFLLRSFSFSCTRLNGLTYRYLIECIGPSLQSYINQYFCDSIAYVRIRKFATKIASVMLRLYTAINRADFRFRCMLKWETVSGVMCGLNIFSPLPALHYLTCI